MFVNLSSPIETFTKTLQLYDPLTVLGRSDKLSVKFLVQRVANSPN